MKKNQYHKMLAKDTILYGVGRSIVSIISFIMLPFYTRILGEEGYGLLSLFITFSGFLIVFFRWGLHTAYTRFYFESDEIEYKHRIFSTAIGGILILNIPFLLLIGFYRSNISSFITSSNQYGALIIISAITTYFSALHHLPFSKYQTERQTIKYILYRLVFSLLTVLFNIYVLFYTQHKVRNLLLSTLSVNIIFIFIWGHLYIDVFRFSIWKDKLYYMLKFSFPLVLVGLSQWVLSMTDKIFLSHFSTIGDVGIYSFGSKIASIITIGIVGPFTVAWTPLLFMINKEKEKKHIFKQLSRYWLLVLFVISFLLILFAKETINIMGGSKFMGAYYPMWIVLMGNVFYGMYQYMVFGPLIDKKTHILSIITVIAGIVNLLLNFVFVPAYGKTGAAITFAISNVGMFIAILYVNNMSGHLKLQYKDLLFALLFGILIMIGFISLYINIYVKFLLLLLMLFFIYYIVRKVKESYNSIIKS